MTSVLIIGAGGVGEVVTQKCAQFPKIFGEICLASRSIVKCKRIISKIKREVQIAEIDADDPDSVISLIKKTRADVVINVASPYQNLSIMKACCKTGTHYLDTSLDDLRDRVKYDYADQWAFDEGFKKQKATAILSIGFDPGVVNVFCAHAQKHLFDEIESIDIFDCNAGDHGYEFATNFDPETNLREILADVISYEDGAFQTNPALTIRREFNFPGIGKRTSYLMSHEEILSLSKFISGVKSIRFWMALNERYLTHLRVLQNIGMTSISPIEFEGKSVVPIAFLKALLPDPAMLGSTTKGMTCIGCHFVGKKNGVPKEVILYNNCRHEKCYEEFGSQAISFTTAVPIVLAARLIFEGRWNAKGVFCPEQLDPDPFMDLIGKMGLSWKIIESQNEISQ